MHHDERGFGSHRRRGDCDGMSTSGGTRAIIAALLANLGIAVTKFIAFLLSGSSSMLAESVHSLADSGNQVLLLIGGKRAQPRGRRRSIRSATAGSGTSTRSWCRSSCSASAACSPSTRACTRSSTRSRSTLPWIPIAVLLIAIGARVVLAAHRAQGVRARAAGDLDPAVRPPGQGARTAGRGAGGHRRAGRPGARLRSASASR